MKTAYVIAGLIILFIVILPIIINLTGYSYSLVSKNVTRMYKTVRDKFEYKDKAMLLFLVGCNNGIIYIKNDQYLIYKLYDQSQIISQEKNELDMYASPFLSFLAITMFIWNFIS